MRAELPADILRGREQLLFRLIKRSRSLAKFSSMTSSHMIVFHTDPVSSTATVDLSIPRQARRVERFSFLERLSKRLSMKPSSSASAVAAVPVATSSPPSHPLERQNSSDSDLSLSKLDITDEYSGATNNDSLNTSRQTSELDLHTRKTTPRSFSCLSSQRFVEILRNLYARLSQTTKKKRTRSTDSNARLTSRRRSFFDLCSCCWPRRTTDLAWLCCFFIVVFAFCQYVKAINRYFI